MPGYWLMKSEPDTFGIDDLARVKVEPWTGVRNYTARNFMRDQMKVGDLALFYHSNAEPPGVAGVARIVRTGVVDALQFDPASEYFDPGSKRDDPRWICVEVEYVETLPRLVSLDELRGNPALEGMAVLQKGQRLSVQPVSAPHYKAVLAMAKKPARAAPVRSAGTARAPGRGRPSPDRARPAKRAR